MTDLNYANIDLIDEMYEKYLQNPHDVDSTWRNFFEQADRSAFVPPEFKAEGDLRVFNLIQAYRSYGHLLAKINPIIEQNQNLPLQLQLESFGLSSKDKDQQFPTYGLLKQERASLSEIIHALQSTYCGNIGIEYMGLQNPEMEQWIQQRIEPTQFKMELPIDQKKMILQHLNKSELFESFIHTKYVGQKRFSLEGGETLVPMLEAVIENGAELGIEEFVIGMAHRGRLNVLSNIMNKSYADIFSEFEEGYIPDSFEGSGDVKYHKGYLSNLVTVKGRKVSIVLPPNPSHLESVDPVVEGQVRAKQDVRQDESRKKSMPILVHGDAAIAGQGVVYETMQFYKLPGYETGGTLHFIINNQIGFTTIPSDGRSTRYCTDIAHTFGFPIFHVNAEDPEACVTATILALEFRQKFHCDVLIDLVCYRKYGHNEGDEPAFTQPLEYQIIRKKRPIREIYRDQLIQQGVLEKKIAESLEEEFKKGLNEALQQIKVPKKQKEVKHSVPEKEYKFEVIQTGVPKKTLQEIAIRFCQVPEGFNIHPKLQNLLKERLAITVDESKPVDWGMAEILAYGSLLWEGTSVRLSGQDCGRGTFSHRHAVWVDQVAEREYYPLDHLKPEQGHFEVYNSSLSEYAVLGFEYGYSVIAPDRLVIWEAQFGDFCNGAQIIIDQYIATAEQKWGVKFGLTLFLPHGYEGQGPEHSSGRMERFLALCGNDNMQVVNPTTPSQLFHLLRRQILQPFRKPLIVFTPKGLLRHPECVSTLDELTQGSFQEILEEKSPVKNAQRLVFCCGRIYYDLIAARAQTKTNDMAFVRIEQLYPLNIQKLKEIIAQYKNVKEYYWAQEEPSNMGGWDFIRTTLQELIPEKLQYVGRARSASPAVGAHALHKKEHAALLETLFTKSERS